MSGNCSIQLVDKRSKSKAQKLQTIILCDRPLTLTTAISTCTKVTAPARNGNTWFTCHVGSGDDVTLTWEPLAWLEGELYLCLASEGKKPDCWNNRYLPKLPTHGGTGNRSPTYPPPKAFVTFCLFPNFCYFEIRDWRSRSPESCTSGFLDLKRWASGERRVNTQDSCVISSKHSMLYIRSVLTGTLLVHVRVRFPHPKCLWQQ